MRYGARIDPSALCVQSSETTTANHARSWNSGNSTLWMVLMFEMQVVFDVQIKD